MAALTSAVSVNLFFFQLSEASYFVRSLARRERQREFRRMGREREGGREERSGTERRRGMNVGVLRRKKERTQVEKKPHVTHGHMVVRAIKTYTYLCMD